VAGLVTAFGSGAMTNSISEISDSKMLFVIGANPSEAHPVIAAKMRQARRKGAGLIVVDPRKTELAAMADVWLRLKPGSDVALLNGLMHIILRDGLQDRDFISHCTSGFDAVATTVAQYPPDVVEQITGVNSCLLEQAAHLYAKAERAQIFYTLGITEHCWGTDNVLSIANLAMLTGNVGNPCSGVNPLRGQNNVQGACDMGALPDVLPGYRKVTDEDERKRFEQVWQVALPSVRGFTIPEMFTSAVSGEVKAMYIVGENPVLSDANANHVTHALKSLEFLVVQDIFLTETALLADVVLPAASFAEKNGTFTNTERRIQLVRKAVEPPGQSRTDLEIIADLSSRIGYPMHYTAPVDVMQEITALTRIYHGVTYERLQERGLQWPVPDTTHPGTPFLHENGQFTCGLGWFTPVEYHPPAEGTDTEYPLVLTTGRRLYHYNVSTFGKSAALSEHLPQERLWIHPADARKLELINGQCVHVESRRGSIQTNIWLTESVPPGLVWLSFHFPDAPTNQITNDAGDQITRTYEYKVCAVRISVSSTTADMKLS
jgi:formate dehydrogenase alpha subunit